MLDLTVLLATGRAPESVTDYLGSGEQMSERVRCPLFVPCSLGSGDMDVFTGDTKMGDDSRGGTPEATR